MKKDLDERIEEKIQEMSTEAGPTGEFPKGKIAENDEGELAVELFSDCEGNVILNFNTDVKWIGMSAEEAIEFGERIAQLGKEIRDREVGGCSCKKSHPEMG